MSLQNLFSVAIGRFDYSSGLPLARKIFNDNSHLLYFNNRNLSNFILQTPNKHVVNENYVNVADVDKLKSFLLDCGIQHLKDIGFHVNFFSYQVINLWLNEYKHTNFQLPHNHPGYLVSGVFYVDVPKDGSPLIFHNPNQLFQNHFILSEDKQYNCYNSNVWNMFPNEGEVLIFNSNLVHEVPRHNSNEIRRTIAFDITVDQYLPNEETN